MPPVIATLPAPLLRKSRSPRACIWPPFGKDSGSEDPAESIRLDRATYLAFAHGNKNPGAGAAKAGNWELGDGGTVDYFNDVLVEDGQFAQFLAPARDRFADNLDGFKVRVVGVVISASYAVGVDEFNCPPPRNVWDELGGGVIGF